MNSDQQLLLTVLIRLGFVTSQQVSGLGDGTLDPNSDTIEQLVDSGTLDAQKLAIAKRLAVQLPADASNRQIDDLIVKSYGSLDRETNPSLAGIEEPDYPTDIDSRLIDGAAASGQHEAAPHDPDATLVPSDGDPSFDPYKTIPPQKEKVAGETTRKGGFRFRVIRKHAEGGLGMVSLAEDVDFGRDVAIKEIKERFADIPDSRSRFVYEAEITGRLEHPGIVPVYALGKYQDGRPYYAMRFVTGDGFDAAIADLHDPSNADEFFSRLRSLLSRFQSVCNTIEYAHSRDVLHRDLKPENIMIGEYGENLVVDWGLAKSLSKPDPESSRAESLGTAGDAHQTRMGSIVGTPYYMSPEQASGDSDSVGPQADVYSLGATLFHLLTGKPPYREMEFESVSQLLRSVKEGETRTARQVNPRVPKPLDAICMAAMAVDRGDRYASAAALADDIEKFLADDHVSVAKESVTERLGRWSRKNRSWTMAIAASVLIIALATSVASVVTVKALNDTELANGRLENQLTLAKLEQAFDSQVVKEEKRQASSGLSLDQFPLNIDLATELQNKLEEIESTRATVSAESPADQQRRLRLLNNWTNSIEMILAEPSFTLGVEQLATDEISALEKGYRWPDTDDFRDQLSRLRSRLKSRQGEWRPVPQESLPADSFALEPDGSWRRLPVDSPDDWLVMMGDCPGADVSLEMDFGDEAASSPMVGLVLNATGETSYQFVLAEQDYGPGYLMDEEASLQDLSDRDRLWMYIIRQDSEFDATVLRAQPVKLDGSLRMRVRRESLTRLTFSVGGSNVIEFDDPFPTGVSDPGQLGLICPGGVVVTLPVVQSHLIGEDIEYAPSPIMLGDAKRAAGEIDAAREEYSKLPDDIEARFKLALTFEADEDEEVRQLRGIVDSFSPDGSLDERTKRWYLNSAMRLMNKHMNRGQRVFAGEVQDRIWPYYKMKDVQRLVPASDKAEFQKMLLKPGQRWRIAYVNDGDADSLRRSIDLFSDSPQLRRDALWRWCDAIRCDLNKTSAEGRKQAVPAIRELITEVADQPERNELELSALVSDLVWMLMVDNQLDEAMKAVSPWVEGSIERLPIHRIPILLERARIQIRRGNPEQAERDLLAVVARIDPNKPQDGIRYAHFSEAYALLGLLAKDDDDLEKAQQYWLKGRRRNWNGTIPMPTEQDMVDMRGAEMVLEDVACDEILASWTDGYSESMLDDVVNAIFGGSGVEDSALLNIIRRTEKIPRPWLKMIAESFYAGKRGEIEGRRFLLRQSSMRSSTTYGAMMMLYQAVLQTAFDGEESLIRFPDMDAVLHGHIQTLIAKYQEQAFVQKEMAFILGAWTGKDWNSKTFESLAKRLDDPGLSASMATIFAIQMIKHQGKLELGQKVLDKYVYPMRDQLPQFYFVVIDETIQQAKQRTP